jgi:hypothetical protein
MTINHEVRKLTTTQKKGSFVSPILLLKGSKAHPVAMTEEEYAN